MAQVNLGHVVGPGVPTGGTANQVLVKNGATNFDTSWKDASQLPAIGDEETAREAADAALADGLAIIANGDTHAAVAAGQAVFVRSHSTLAPGLYWASSAIGTNAALSTSNLTADSQGGLNKLKGDIDSLNSNLGNLIKTVDLRATTESNGNLTVPDTILTTNNLLLCCIPNRAVAYGSVYTVAVSTTADNSKYLLTLKHADNSVVASKEVVIKFVYV